MPDHVLSGARIDAKKLARAKEFRRQMTPGEARMWARLRGNRLGGFHFRRQQVIAGFIADFYCHIVGLVIEVDGDIHKAKIEEDRVRDDILKDLGFTVLRVRDEDVRNNLENVLACVYDTCQRLLEIQKSKNEHTGVEVGDRS